jgi:acyl-coenzyme A synthetase/AMP-(fatty) acid ligase
VDVAALRSPSLRYVAQAGGAMQAETIRWARQAFAPARLFVMYGQTEATARLSYLPPERAVDKEGSIGRGLDNVELRIVDEEGRELPPGEVGELVARGPSITPGYFRAPEETAAILREGWLWTGDLGWRDEEGFVFLVGRAKDMLKLAGHRVSAAEIEGVLLTHPAIREAAVVGGTDEHGTEIAIAGVVPEPGAAPHANEVRRFCRERLPAFKVPRKVNFLSELPRTASGKVAKAALRGEDDG